MTSPPKQGDPLAAASGSTTRPPSVSKAVVMLYVSLGLAALRSAVAFNQMFELVKSDGSSGIDTRVVTAVVGQVVILAGLAVLYFCIGQRKNWARRVYIAVTILFIAMMVQAVLHSAPEVPFVGVVGIGQAALQVWALVLLFRPEAAVWFRRVPTRNERDGPSGPK
jgi:hypothetical protein